jgi:L-asparaginase / beta-aspartyl-peptidase
MRRLIAAAMLVFAGACAMTPPQAPAPEWTLVIHGGAGLDDPASYPEELKVAWANGLDAALKAGEAVLASGGSAVDAVEASVKVLEDDPNFNAGRGAVLTRAGIAELDAAIMDGETRKAGAVTGLTTTRHPISAARAVMTQTRHVLLAGDGANAFAASTGLEQVDPSFFITERRRRQLERAMSEPTAMDTHAEFRMGTVGAVARDRQGRLAAATSTGGLTAKMPGRVGDTPIVGAGTYADSRVCAISGTGQGEAFMRTAAANTICLRASLTGESLLDAMTAVLADIKSLGGDGGLIATGPSGEVAWAWNTPGMLRASSNAAGQRRVGMWDDERPLT